MAANNFQSGGVDNNWGTVGNWSLGAVPTASDGNVATFTAASPNCTVNASNRVCNHINFTAYTNTITFTYQITVSGNVTLGASMNFAGAAGLLSATGGTWTSNGKVCPQPITWTGAFNYQLNGDWTNSALVTIGSGTATTGVQQLSAEKLYCRAGLTIGGTTAIVTGSVHIVLSGTGQWQGPSAGGGLRNNLTFDAGAGTITVSTNVYYNTGILTYTSGVMNVSGTLTIALSTTLNTSGMSWYGVTVSATATLTLSSDLNVAGTMILTGATTFSGNFNISVGALTCNAVVTHTLVHDVTVSGLTTISSACVINGAYILNTGGLNISANATGTLSKINFNNTGIWSGVGQVPWNIDIAWPASLTISGTVYFKTRTLHYLSGTIDVTGSTLTLPAAATIDTSSMSWNNITISANVTITLASNLGLSGTLLESVGGCTFSGAFTIYTSYWTISGGTTVITTLSGNITVAGLLTLSNSTQTTFSGAYSIQAGSCTISNTQTVVLAADITVTGTLTIADATILNGTQTWYVGGLTMTGAITSGESYITLTGGIWSGTGNVKVNMFLQGDITVSGTVSFGGNASIDLHWNSGTLTTTGSTLIISGSCIISTDGDGTPPSIWNNITISAAATIIISFHLKATGTLTMPNAAVSFVWAFFGSFGFTVGTLINTTIAASAKTYTFDHLMTYIITGAMNLSGASAALTLTLISDDGSLKVPIVLGPGATQDVAWIVATRIDSSAGQTIFDYKGTLTTCFNWVTAYPINAALSDPQLIIAI